MPAMGAMKDAAGDPRKMAAVILASHGQGVDYATVGEIVGDVLRYVPNVDFESLADETWARVGTAVVSFTWPDDEDTDTPSATDGNNSGTLSCCACMCHNTE